MQGANSNRVYIQEKEYSIRISDENCMTMKTFADD